MRPTSQSGQSCSPISQQIHQETQTSVPSGSTLQVIKLIFKKKSIRLKLIQYFVFKGISKGADGTSVPSVT